ncbi:MAG: hypothetical protein ACON47_01030 [Flavobacteriaceae bacterium]
MKFEPREDVLLEDSLSQTNSDSVAIDDTSTPVAPSFELFPQLSSYIEGNWNVTGYLFTRLPDNPNNLNEIELSNRLDNPKRMQINFTGMRSEYAWPFEEDYVFEEGDYSDNMYGYHPKANDGTPTNIAIYHEGCDEVSEVVPPLEIYYTVLAFREIDPNDHPAINMAREKYPNTYFYGFSIHPWDGYFLRSSETGCSTGERFGCEQPGYCSHRDVFLCFFTNEGKQLNLLQDTKEENYLEVFEWHKIIE